MEGRYNRIDLYAIMSFRDQGFVGAKYSSAYLPHEMVGKLDGRISAVRTYQPDEERNAVNTGMLYDLMPAYPVRDSSTQMTREIFTRSIEWLCMSGICCLVF